MSAVDIGIVALALAMAYIGSGLGFVRSALPLLGFVGGAIAGGRIGPALLSAAARVALCAGDHTARGALRRRAHGSCHGRRQRAHPRRVQAAKRRRPARRTGRGDPPRGAGPAGLVWAFGAVALHSVSSGGREIRQVIADSRVLGKLNDLLPPSGPLLNVLRRIDPAPTVRGPSADVPAPDRRILQAPGVRRAGGAVVKVIGTACGLGVEGSGWSAGHGLFVTNAHVVAGEGDTKVIPPAGGDGLDATVVHYDPRNDLAILRVDALDLPALALGSAKPGIDAAILGYPENGPYSAAPARLGRTGRGHDPGLIWARTDPQARDPVPRRGEERQLGRPDRRRQGPRRGDRVRRQFRTVRAGGLAVPDSVVRQALEAR